MADERVASLFPARDQALVLLSDLCEHSLDVPLSHVDSMDDGELAHHPTSAKFKWLRDLIQEGIQT